MEQSQPAVRGQGLLEWYEALISAALVNFNLPLNAPRSSAEYAVIGSSPIHTMIIVPTRSANTNGRRTFATLLKSNFFLFMPFSFLFRIVTAHHQKSQCLFICILCIHTTCNLTFMHNNNTIRQRHNFFQFC